MSNALASVLPIASDLEIGDRAKLAEQLLLSLDESSETEIEQLWIAESRRRLAAWRAGTVEAVPAEEVFHRAVADLS